VPLGFSILPAAIVFGAAPLQIVKGLISKEIAEALNITTGRLQ